MPMPGSSDSQKRYRDRRRNGLRCYRLTLSDNVIETLIDLGLPETAVWDRQCVARELESLIEQWAQHLRAAAERL
ncbi:hypothetical protein Q2941_04745 [Bradyrhizobium sp. UFLA05-153]